MQHVLLVQICQHLTQCTLLQALELEQAIVLGSAMQPTTKTEQYAQHVQPLLALLVSTELPALLGLLLTRRVLPVQTCQLPMQCTHQQVLEQELAIAPGNAMQPTTTTMELVVPVVLHCVLLANIDQLALLGQLQTRRVLHAQMDL